MKQPLPYWALVLTVALTLIGCLVAQHLTRLDRRLDRLEQQPTPTLTRVVTRDISLPARASRSHVRRPLTQSHRTTSHRWSVTAYCATGNRTASGAWPRIGMAATLDRSIPFGTRLSVPGVGVVTVTDRIGHGSDLDLYLGTGTACENAARAWGRRRLTVEVVA